MIDVLQMATTASGRPVLVRSIPVVGQPLGETITPDGQYLLAADGNGAVVINVARAESGAASAVLGRLAAPSGTGQGALSASSIEVATLRDGRYAFVALLVTDPSHALDGRPAIVGDIPAGLFPRDMTAAPNGTVLVSNFSSGQLETVDTATIP